MPEEYTKEQFWKLYEKLPEELKEAIFSVETSDHIWDICERNDIEEVSSVAKYVGNVLLGLLLPEDFSNALEVELKLEKEIAEKVAKEINRFIFYPVKPTLEQLYKIGGAPAEEETEKPTAEKPEIKPTGGDKYRESLE